MEPHVCAWKLGSGDITWHENIERLAISGKPLLIATGAANIEEVRLAVQVAKKHTDDIILMQCNTNYTASLENFHHIALNVLKTYYQEFPDLVLGISDHTPGHSTVLGAVTLGARAVEKHFVLQRRAIRTTRTIQKGAEITETDLIMLRPCPVDAIPPYRKSEIVGKIASKDIAEGDCVRMSDIE